MGLGDKIKHAADQLLHRHGTTPNQDAGRDPSEFPEAEPLGSPQEYPAAAPLGDPHTDPDESPLDDPHDPDGDTTGGSFTGPVPDDPIERIASPREDQPPAV